MNIPTLDGADRTNTARGNAGARDGRTSGRGDLIGGGQAPAHGESDSGYGSWSDSDRGQGCGSTSRGRRGQHSLRAANRGANAWVRPRRTTKESESPRRRRSGSRKRSKDRSDDRSPSAGSLRAGNPTPRARTVFTPTAAAEAPLEIPEKDGRVLARLARIRRGPSVSDAAARLKAPSPTWKTWPRNGKTGKQSVFGRRRKSRASTASGSK